MTVKVRRKTVRLRLWLPLRTAVKIIFRAVQRETAKAGAKLKLTRQGKKLLRRTIKDAKKQFTDMHLLEVEAEGATVIITL